MFEGLPPPSSTIMSCILAALRLSCALLAVFVKGGRADNDDSTDALITFGQPCMNDTTPYPYHQSVSAWYETFLKVAVRFIAQATWDKVSAISTDTPGPARIFVRNTIVVAAQSMASGQVRG
jgi:hypothetical protein